MSRLRIAVAVAALASALASCSAEDDALARFRRPEPRARTAPATVSLGRDLFFDERLSGGRGRSCGTCHVPGLAWGDGLPRAAGLSGRPLPVRTPSLVGLADASGPMGWDGKFADLESVAFGPIGNPDNMGSSEAAALKAIASAPAYGEAFARAFGDPAVTRPRVEAALGAFIRDIPAPRSRFDRFVEGERDALTARERRGFALFDGKAGCSCCHSGWALTDGSFHDVGTPGPAPGRGRLFPDSAKLQHAWKTPGLREVGRRAPYMHDGSVPTLEAVVERYDRGGASARSSLAPEIVPLGLTARDKADLVAFLRSLDGTEPAIAERGRQASIGEGSHDGHR